MDTPGAAKLQIRNLSVRNGQDILKGISFDIPANQIVSAIGPAGSGKTTFLRCLNRMIDFEENLTVSGRVFLDGSDILSAGTNLIALRKRVSMVFAVPTPLPMSLRDNLALGLTFQGGRLRVSSDERVEKSLKAAFLWDEVKDRLNESAMRLSGGQQQRLCLARSLMTQPEVLLLDEPCSGLDPISTAKIEDALKELKKNMTIVLVTNNVKQAARTSDRTAFFFLGELVEEGDTGQLFTNPREQRTGDYVSGRFG